jgi:hypothetical protein
MNIEYEIDPNGNLIKGVNKSGKKISLVEKIQEIGNWINTEDDDMTVVKAKQQAQRRMYERELFE